MAAGCNRSMIVLMTLSIILLKVHLAKGSAGDYDPKYRKCKQGCDNKCEAQESRTLDESRLLFPPYGFSLICWDCFDLCHYMCMMKVTHARLTSGLSVLKYNGHWPFIRWFGLEEFASAVFSLLNSMPHIQFILRNQHFITSSESNNAHNYYMTPWILGYSIVAVNAWIASTLYHSQKNDWATRYDLTSALLLLSFGFFLCMRRLLGYPLKYKFIFYAISLLGLSLLCTRLYYMVFTDEISFGVHMKTCFLIVALTTILWIVWMCVDVLFRGGIHDNVKWCAIVQVWFLLAALLEIFDFPPLLQQTFDAHSLWHAATIPLGFIWYHYWHLDMLDQVALLLRKSAKEV